MAKRTPKPRVIEPNRSQGEMRFDLPEDRLPPEHPARVLDRVVGTLDLAGFTRDAKAVEGCAGRTILSPRMKLTLWLYAISRGIGSAREIERLTRSDDAFRWIVGDLEVSHHTLSSFRVGHELVLDQLMTDVLASLMHKGLLTLEMVAQDGTRVRASASAPSFRTYGSLLECRRQAALHLKAVLAAAEDPAEPRRRRTAQEAAARDFQRRVEEAIKTVSEMRADRRPHSGFRRASTTDADARVMKMPDGGFRPGYNVQLAVAGSEEGGPRTIVGLRVTNVGSDMGGITPMLDDVERRTGELPGVLLADANHAKHSCIEAATRAGVQVIAAVARHAGPLEETSPEVAAWRERMATEEAKRLYRARAGLVELLNAHLKTRFGIDRVLVRGLPKVRCVVLLAGLGFNLLQHATRLLA
jgi:transposase